jgi:hypothetical protein
MPYLGHRDSVYSDMGISADAPAAPDNPLEAKVAALVSRAARDDDDRQLLLEALGLVPTVDQLAEAG